MMSIRERYVEATQGATVEWLSGPQMSDLVHALIVSDRVTDPNEWFKMAIDSELSSATAYGAFIGATTVARRQRNYRQFLEFVRDDRVHRRFLSSPEQEIADGYRMHTAEAMMYGIRIGAGGSQQEALSITERLLPRFEGHHGAQNLLVEIVLSTTDPTEPDLRLIDKAARANDRSIELEPQRAKYVAHRGVIRAYQGRYREAETSIQQAIDLEDSNRWDYSAMVADHQSRLSLIQSIRLSREINEEVERARQEIADSRGQLLTLTALLAAVVAIVIVNAGVAQSIGNIADAIALIFAGTGAITLTFGLLIGLVLTPRTRSQWVLLGLVVTIAVALMLTGLVRVE